MRLARTLAALLAALALCGALSVGCGTRGYGPQRGYKPGDPDMPRPIPDTDKGARDAGG